MLDQLWSSFAAQHATLLVQMSIHCMMSRTGLQDCCSSCQLMVAGTSAAHGVLHDKVPVMSVAKHMDMTLQALCNSHVNVQLLALMQTLTTCLLFHLHAFLSGSERSGNTTASRHPHTLACRRALMPAYFAISACLSLLTIGWQLRAGQRRFKRACHALRILPSPVAVGLLTCVAGKGTVKDRSVIQTFLLQQLWLQCRPCPAENAGGSLYALLCKNTYVGVSTAQEHPSWGRDPMRRFVEHLHCPPMLMRKDPPSTVGYVWLHDVASKAELFHVEACHISQSQPSANRTFKVADDLRLPGSGRARPHRRLRVRRAAFFRDELVQPCLPTCLLKLARVHACRHWPPAPVQETSEQSLARHLHLPFLLMYRLVQQTCCVAFGVEATVLHYAWSLLLLTQWVCSKGCRVDWPSVHSLWGSSIAYRLVHCVSAHPRPGYKRRGLGFLSRYMRWAHELPLKTVVLKLPSFARVVHVGSALHKVAWQLSRGVPARWQWLQSHLKLSTLPKPSIKVRRFKMQQVMKHACWADYEALHTDDLAHVLLGKDMMRVKLWAKFPDVGHPRVDWGRLRSRIREVCGLLRLSLQERKVFEQAVLRAVSASVPQNRYMSPLQQYAMAFPYPNCGECLVQEDKDSAACWKMPCFSYQMRMCHLLALDDKWLPTELSVQQAAILRANTIAATPLSKGRVLHASPDPGHLPYGYGTVKAKCFKGSFATGWQHSCEKPGHSCFRKIVSWGRCEASVRRIFRQVSRAATILVAKYCLGWETLSLKSSIVDLRRRIEKLDFDCICCPCCKKPRNSRISLLVADAGQMYEQIQPADVLSNLKTVIERAQQEGYRVCS